MSRDVTAVFLACLGYGETISAEQLAHVSAEEWRAIVTLAGQHSVAPLLYHRLKLLKILLPGDATEKLKRAYLRNMARNMCLYQELDKLLHQLREQDIAVIALKGIHLAGAVYEDIGLRTMGDIDLLVKRDDLTRVEQVLLALDYEPDEYNRVISKENHHFAYTRIKVGINVEIHWALFASNIPFQVDMAGLWSRARSMRLAQSPALVLSPVDLLLHLCLHTAVHTYDMRIRMLCDIGEVVQRYETELDWQMIAVRARQWGIVHAVFVTLWLARELLGVAVPADWLSSLEPAGVEEHYLALARQEVLVAGIGGDMARHARTARLWGPKDTDDKLALIRERLLPSRERMANMYPAPANSWRIYLYYPARIKDVLLRHGAMLWRLVFGDSKTRNVAEHTNQVSALHDWLMSK